MDSTLRLAASLALISLLSGVLLFGSPPQDSEGPVPTFHVVAFLGTVEDPERFGSRAEIEFPSAQFPQWFTALATGLPVESDLDPQLVSSRIPKGLVMLDVCTFYGQEADSKKKRWDKRKSGSRFTYRLTAVSWTPENYVAELETWGLHRLKPFRVTGPMTSTMMTAFPVDKDQFLFFAVTPQEANPYIVFSSRGQGENPPSWRLVDKVNPVYPEDMRLNRTQGLVSMSTALTPEGKVDSRRLVLLECNHLSFCRAAAEAVSQWRYDYSDIGHDRIITTTVRFVLR